MDKENKRQKVTIGIKVTNKGGKPTPLGVRWIA